MLTLTDLPIEIFQHVCGYLEARYVLELGRTCVRFQNWIHDPCHWRIRLNQRWPMQFPALPDQEIEWQEACVIRENAHRVWGGLSKQFLHHSQTSHGISQGIDAIHILPPGDLILVGGRDRYFSVIRRNDLISDVTNSVIAFQDNHIHSGWIWTISSCQGHILTGSWDLYARFFEMEDVTPKLMHKHKLRTAVLSSAFLSPDTAVVGTYGRNIFMLDRRQGPTSPPPVDIQHHQGAVLQLAAASCGETTKPAPEEESLPVEAEVASLELGEKEQGSVEGCGDLWKFFSTGDDRLLAAWDLRNTKTPLNTHTFKAYAKTMAVYGNQLWLIDKNGKFHLFDTRHGKLDHIQEHPHPGITGSARAVGGLHVDAGFILTGSLSGTVQALHPARRPELMAAPLITDVSGGLCCLSYHNKSLAVGSGNGSVLYWSEKTDEDLQKSVL